ncbi:MAG: heterodisulfide reductase-related iron-sulfur binding cluster, partial [Nitrospinota bacterium]
VLTTTQWMLNNAEKLGLSKTDKSITFHDSCHCTRKLGLGTPARELIGKMYTLKEMEKSGEKALCCGYYNFKSNPELNHKLRLDKMDMVKKTGTNTLAVECITCQESFESEGKETGIEVTDLVDLVHKNVFP